MIHHRNHPARQTLVSMVLGALLIPAAFGAAVTFNLDSSQSYITVSGTVAGQPLTTQGPGSLTTHFSGTVDSTLDNTASPTQITITGSTLDATTSGQWHPLAGGADGVADADLGGSTSGSLITSGNVAVRNFVVNGVTATAVPVTGNQFVSTGIQFTLNAGSTVDYRVTTILGSSSGTKALGGIHTNNIAGPGTITRAGSTTTLQIPLDFYIVLSISSQPVILHCVGAVVGTATVQPPPDTTAPTLAILSPTNYQSFTNAAITVTGTASDASGLASVTVNGTTATRTGDNWSAPLPLTMGTNTLTVIATDASANHNAATQAVHAVRAPIPPSGPSITTAPTITNPLAKIGNIVVIVAGETNTFTVGASGQSLQYQWIFGDGVTNGWSASSIATHIYSASQCGPSTATVRVTDGTLTTASNLNVAVACALAIAKPAGKLSATVNLNPKKTNADSASLTGVVGVPSTFTVLGKTVTVNAGGAQITFLLDKSGRGLTGTSTCRLTYTKPTKTKAGYWTVAVALNKGTWGAAWAQLGLINANIKTPGNSVVFPVWVLVGDEAFVIEQPLKYTAALNKTGTAK